MITTVILIYTIALSMNLFCASTEIIDVRANKIFGNSGLDIDSQDVNIISKLVKKIDQATEKQLSDAARLLLDVLTEQYQKLIDQMKQLDAAKKTVPQKLFFHNYIMEKRIEHVKKFSNKPSSETIGQWLWKKITNSNEAGPDVTAQAISNLMMQFYSIEDQLLTNYQQLLFYEALLKRYSLPQFMMVLSTPNEFELLKKHVRQIQPEVQVQFISTLVSFAVQGFLMAGGTVATQFVDKADQDLFDAMKQQQNKIQSEWEDFQKSMIDRQKEIMTRVTTAFTTSAQALQDQYGQDQQRLTEETIYIAQAINLAKPVERFLDPYYITWDQLFATSKMITPNSDQLPWYNVYNVTQAGSDWQYNSQTNSFWQYGYTPFPRTLYWTDPKNAHINIDDPAAFSIFNEFATDAAQYRIEIDLTLSTSTYPFFAGILWNRGRWISGSPERLWQYRLLGLFGQELTPNMPTIDLAFSQPIIVPATDNAPEQIISPLENIITKPATRLFRLSDAQTKTVQNKPTTFNFVITTAPTTVSCQLSLITEDAKGNRISTPMYTKTIANLNRLDFIFSGIGFIAIGCQAEFKIKEPAALVYNQEAINEYTQYLQKLIKSQ